MSKPAFSKGLIAASGVHFGPDDNTSFTVDKTSGQVTFAVGEHSAGEIYDALPGTNITKTTLNSDAIFSLNNWLAFNLLDTAPAFTVNSVVADSQAITVQLTPPEQKYLAFLSVAVPHIQSVRVQIVASGLDFTDASVRTLIAENVPAGQLVNLRTLRFAVVNGTDGLVGTVFTAYGIVPTQQYNIRVYGVNESKSALKYTIINGVATLGVSPPSAPLQLNAVTVSSSAINTSWSRPTYRDSGALGNLSATPYFAQYRVNRTALSSVRFGGVLTDTGSMLTAATTVTDAVLNLSLTSLRPGTQYSLTVTARNSVNPSFGDASTSAMSTTFLPIAPSFLSSTDASTLNTSLAPSLASGYNLEGTTPLTNIIRTGQMTTSNIMTVTATSRRTNAVVADSSLNIGTLYAYGGPASTLFSASEHVVMYSVPGYPATSLSGTVSSISGGAKLVYSADRDHYAAAAEQDQGFYKSITATAAAGTIYPPSASAYALALRYVTASGTIYSTNAVTFYSEDAIAAPTTRDGGITGVVNASTVYISGIPTWGPGTVFKLQFIQEETAHYFLRSDRKHADIQLRTLSQQALSSSVSVGANVSGNKYFTVPVLVYNTSTSQTTLTPTSTPVPVQFNTYTVTLNSSAIYDEDVQLRVQSYSFATQIGVATGGISSFTYLNTSEGGTKKLRVDNLSIAALRATSSFASTSKGQQVKSGSGQFPVQFGDDYDHTESIIATEELQLIGGAFSTPAFGQGYKDYTQFYLPITGLDYSPLVDDTVRWLTLKYTSVIPSGSITYGKLQISIVHQGLVLQPASTSNFSCYIFSTAGGGWLDATKAISGLGLGTATNGTPCSDVSSNASLLRAYIQPGTGFGTVFYVRVGLSGDISASVSTVEVSAVESFP